MADKNFWPTMLKKKMDELQGLSLPALQMPARQAALPGMPERRDVVSQEQTAKDVASDDLKNSATQTSKGIQLSSPILSDDLFKKVRQRAEDLTAPERQASADYGDFAHKVINSNTSPDLSPLIGFIRGFQGQEHIGEGYQAPISATKRQELALGIAGQLNKDQNTIADNQRDIMKSSIIPAQPIQVLGTSNTQSEDMKKIMELLTKNKTVDTQQTLHFNHPPHAATKLDRLTDSAIGKITDLQNGADYFKNLADQIRSKPKSFGMTAALEAKLPNAMQPQDLIDLNSSLATGNAMIQQLVQKGHITPVQAQGLIAPSVGDKNSDVAAQKAEKIYNLLRAQGSNFVTNQAKNKHDVSEFSNMLQAPAAASTGPHGPSVTQNGHTYNWNASTGKYE